MHERVYTVSLIRVPPSAEGTRTNYTQVDFWCAVRLPWQEKPRLQI